MQKRVITPYFGAPDLSAYEDEDMDSVFSPKPEAEVDHSCKYATTKHYLHIHLYTVCFVIWLLFRALCLNIKCRCCLNGHKCKQKHLNVTM